MSQRPAWSDDQRADLFAAEVLQGASAVGVATLDESGRVTVATDGFLRLTGLSLGGRFVDVIAQGQRDVAQAVLDRRGSSWTRLQLTIDGELAAQTPTDRIFRFRHSPEGLNVIVEATDDARDVYRSYQQLVEDLLESLHDISQENRRLRRALGELEEPR